LDAPWHLLLRRLRLRPLHVAQLLRGQRTYVCRQRVACTGLCDRQPIPAELLERHVLNHLGSFIGSVEGWITDQLKEREHARHQCERLLDEERACLRDLDAQRDQRMGEIARLDLSSRRGQIAMELIERIDAQRVAQEQRIIEAKAVLSEWATTPCVDEALDFYNALVDQIDGRVKQASGVRELNETLAGILAGMWCEMEPERERLLVQFALRERRQITPPQKWPDSERLWLPPAQLGYQPIETPAGLVESKLSDHLNPATNLA
jgi:hypothetical protein